MNSREIRSVIFEIGCWAVILMFVFWLLFA